MSSSGSRPPADPADARTLWQLLESRVALTPDAPMLIQELPRPLTGPADRVLTFREVRDRAERIAAGLRERHRVGEGTPVAWQLPTRVETVLVSLALSRLGAVQTPVIAIYRGAEVGRILRDSGARLFLVPGVWRGFDYCRLARELCADWPEPPEVRVAYAAADLPEGDPAALPPAPRTDLSDERAPIRWVYYTSGSTGVPKGARHTDRTLIAGGVGLAGALRTGPADVGSIAFPYAHIGGPDYLVTMLVQGFPALLTEVFALPDALPAYRRNAVTVAGGSTAFYAAFLAEQRKLPPGERLLPSLRLISGGGAPRPPEMYREVAAELGCVLAHGYGMTEAPAICMGSPVDTPDQLAHTEGRPVADAEVRIVRPGPTTGKADPGDAGIGEAGIGDAGIGEAGIGDAGLGETGEVWLRGPMVCRGYTDPELTAGAFAAGGWFRTGDLGYLRPDGHVVLTGRLKDLIIRKGENIAPQEIEDLIYQDPRVGGVAVVGLPDPVRGERVCAVVERRPGLEPPTLAEIAARLRAAGLMAQKIPEQLEVVDALPRNETLRKVLKHELRDLFAALPWTDPAPPPN
ncbi:class I adenylate-forming enzyme family protein [Streptacidiphilus sp. P02-A3a]|uniref:class I adenylate-forming enzyme family protein n=1 Tax=Streptacidiphilus sp. P02-A3a TaxID=2704468 RepID=UPI0015FC7FA4|nr:AMP-binding protein [Streptacidiphilus sp. P02-A3a]QMU67524.1 cyclohexanecarboxylate-CoA ligase [Streptacidiphilus sp. P02-A3a]